MLASLPRVPQPQEYPLGAAAAMSTPLHRWMSWWPVPILARLATGHRRTAYLRLSSSSSSSSSSPSPSSSLVVLTFVFGLLISSSSRPAMARPVSPSDKWRNPCNINFEASSSAESVDFKGADARDSYRGILRAVTDAREFTDATKNSFVIETFGDPSFMAEFEWISYDWLPKIPAATEEHLASLQVEHIKKSLTESYHYLQYFAVAIDQMILDQIMYEGNFLDAYRKIEENLRTALCQFQQSIALLGLKPKDDVRKEVMSEEYRSINADTTRNVRDYIILRDHLNTLIYVANIFGHYVKKLEKET